MDNISLINSVSFSLIISSLAMTVGLIFITNSAWSQPQPHLEQVQQSKRGEVLKELPDIASPNNFTNLNGSQNMSLPPKSLSDASTSKFGNSADSAVTIPDRDLPAEDLEPIKCNKNPDDLDAPCNGTNNADTMIGTHGDDFMYGLKGDDIMSGLANVGGSTGYDILEGGEGADRLYGGPDFDIIAGGIGDDSIYGEDGNDGLYGGEGDDVIEGGAGNDRLWGYEGSDTLNGGDGNDKIYHSEETSSVIYDPGPDGFKDTIDCGDGQDEVWLNIGSDGDVAVNCEKVHGPEPKTLDDANISDDMQEKSND